MAVAAPSVTLNSIQEHNETWSTIDVNYTLSDVDTTINYGVQFDVTVDGETQTVTDSAEKKSNNKLYTRTIDTKELFKSAKRHAQTNVKVSLCKIVPGVQLWANGPIFAECNVGASKPEEYGYYFWWGDTVGYKFVNSRWESVTDPTTVIQFLYNEAPANSTYGKTADQLKKAGYLDAQGNLVSSCDAATAYRGAPWRMPTQAEILALVSNCEKSWKENWNGTGVNGYLVTGKGAYASKSIFLPAAGYGYGSSRDYSGTYGIYWSSTQYSPPYYAWSLNLSNFNADSSRLRYYGYPVRPVQDFAAE